MNITTNINTFIDNYYKNNDKNDDTIRIYFSDIHNSNTNILTNMKAFDEKNIILLISNLKKYKQNNLIRTITQEHYYSQIRETNNKDKNIDIYVLELNLLDENLLILFNFPLSFLLVVPEYPRTNSREELVSLF